MNGLKYRSADHDLSRRPDVEDWISGQVRGFHMYNDPTSVRCYLGHSSVHGPWLELLLQASDGETFVETIHLAGRLDMTKDSVWVRDGVQAVHLLGLFLNRVGQKVVLEHGQAYGRSHRHPIFNEPYHTFDDKVLPWKQDEGPPVLGKRLSSWIALHAAEIRSLGPVEAIDCRLRATREAGIEHYRCDFQAANQASYVVDFRVTGTRRLSRKPVEVASVLDALVVLSHLLREVRLMVTLVPG